VQFLRYGIVSVAALAVDFVGLVILVQYAHINYLLAASISFVAGLLLNYGLSIYWVFHHSSSQNQWRDFIIFSIIGLIGLGLTDLIMWALVSGLVLYYVTSKVIATVIVYFWNFGARKKFIFS